jgi:hypothetical protein
MAEAPDDLDKLLADVRKTISDNRLFLEKLLDETVQEDSGEAPENGAESETAEEDFEEL